MRNEQAFELPVRPKCLLRHFQNDAKNFFVNPRPNPTPVQASAPDLARRVGLIVAALAALVARRFLRDPHLVSLIVPLWTRLTRTARSFDRLMPRVAANRLPKPRPPRPQRPTPSTARATPLPTGHGWLIRALGHEAAAYAGQLDSLLAEPGTADLLAAVPAAARILRPVGRMLGLTAFAPKRNKRRPQAASAPGRVPPCRTATPRPHPAAAPGGPLLPPQCELAPRTLARHPSSPHLPARRLPASR